MPSSFAFLDLGAGELLLILAILVLLFGSKKLPELSRSIGQSVRELKKSASEATGLRDDVRKHVTETKASLNGKVEDDSDSSAQS